MKSFRHPLRSLFVVAAAAALSACGPKIPDALTIAVAQPLSGPQAGRGKDLLDGAKLAVDEINTMGFKIAGKPVTDVIADAEWLQGDFIKTVQQRGAAIIAARGASSAASAANAAIDTVVSLVNPTAAGDWHSVAVYSDGSHYGIAKGIMASMPIRTLTNGTWEVVEGVPVNEFSQGKIDATIGELLEERDAVKDLIPA